ncbi:DegT/DnrJ/EryC1/StrS aminotransferase family protein [uncultured Cocleimonas sp.]|uniref:DegT/DnrJ/EryC1/StrS family aminotransferase n=1 Tax=uncultured Cocleimonas sp. TaxID=1051587 RepID=UPI00261AA0A6|nr:DegT/DnrJ/EryC1/StrS family aminotransferase [uncultured Cocleimonas sp.]
MSDFLPFALPLIGEDEINEVVDTLRSGWLTTGPKTAQFEKDFAEFVNAKHALAVNSATSGLHLALEAVGVGPGDVVITTTYTFTATAEVIRYLGADPILVDIDPKTFNMNPELLREALEGHDNVKAIMPVHFAGQACDMDAILALAKEFDVKVVEDAAHALPTTYKGKVIGSLSDITVYSFYVTKTIATGEGGMIATENEEYLSRMKTMRLHGINRDVFDRYTSDKPSWFYEVVEPGYKYNMTDIAAALGIHQLKRACEFQQRREWMATQYNQAFASLPLNTPYLARPEDTHAWHLYVLQLDLESITVDRNRFIELMAEEKIGTSVHFIPLHLQPYWRDRYNYKQDDYPVALDVFNRAVSLPIYPKMTDEDVQNVIDAVVNVCAKVAK